MILCDTGPIVALINSTGGQHELCQSTLTSLPPRPLLTTWPCVTEAMHFLHRSGGFSAQDEFWSWLSRGFVRLIRPRESDHLRLRELMKKFSDNPMDLADASLVLAAEQLRLRTVFTLDSHFRAYRIHGKRLFSIIPRKLGR